MTEDETAGWHQRLNGHEFEQTLGDGEGQGSLVCCSPWGRKESHTTGRLNSCLWFQASSGGLEHSPLDAEKTAACGDGALRIFPAPCIRTAIWCSAVGPGGSIYTTGIGKRYIQIGAFPPKTWLTLNVHQWLTVSDPISPSCSQGVISVTPCQRPHSF